MRPLKEMLKNATAEMQNEIAKEIDAGTEKETRPLTMGRLEAMSWFHRQGRLAEALERGL